MRQSSRELYDGNWLEWEVYLAGQKETFSITKGALWLGFESQIQISIEWGAKEWGVNGYTWKHEEMLRG